MNRTGWYIAACALLVVAIGIGWPLLRERDEVGTPEVQAAGQQAAAEPEDAQQDAEEALPGGGGSPWRSSVVPTTGKPNQIIHIATPGVASASDAVSVEVYDEEGTPVSWQHVTWLEPMDADALVYALQPLHDGTLLVLFGDGEHGAIPPEANKGVRIRYPAGVGGDGQTATLEIGSTPFGEDGSVDFAEGELWDETADVLRDHASERIFEVITLRPMGEGDTELKLYKVPGRWLHAFLAEGEGLAEGETIVSVGVRE